MRRFAVPVMLAALAIALLATGILCLRSAAMVELSMGYGAVAYLEAFGHPPPRNETQEALRSASRLRLGAWILLGSSLALGLGAALRSRRVLRPKARTEDRHD
jgi:hypothetical protein